MSAVPTAVGRTALVVAAWRDHECQRPDAMVWDHLAGLFVDAAQRSDLAELITGAPLTRELVALRTRWFDELVEAALERGTKQVVLLGAGLDTRAQRLARPGVRFFELDRAEVLAYKHDCLTRHGYPIAAQAIACDYVAEDAGEVLTEAGLAPDQPCLVVWEGNTMYLDASEIGAALTPILARVPDLTLGFDHVSARLVARRSEHRLVDAFARLDAPWRGGWDGADAIAAILTPLGLALSEHRQLAPLAARWSPHRLLSSQLLDDYFVCTSTRA